MRPTAPNRPPLSATPSARAGAFTLIEILVVCGIMAILLAIAGLSWQRLSSARLEAQAVNTITSFAAVARAYALQYDLETILAVSPPTDADPTARLHLFRHGPSMANWVGPWEGSEYQHVREEDTPLPDGLAAGPIDSQNLVLSSDTTIKGATWVFFCFDGTGRLIERANPRLPQPPSSPSPGPSGSMDFTTSLGFKIFRTATLLQHADKNFIDQLRYDDVEDFFNDTTTPNLWQAVALDQWSAQPLAMKQR